MYQTNNLLRNWNLTDAFWLNESFSPSFRNNRAKIGIAGNHHAIESNRVAARDWDSFLHGAFIWWKNRRPTENRWQNMCYFVHSTRFGSPPNRHQLKRSHWHWHHRGTPPSIRRWFKRPTSIIVLRLKHTIGQTDTTFIRSAADKRSLANSTIGFCTGWPKCPIRTVRLGTNASNRFVDIFPQSIWLSIELFS